MKNICPHCGGEIAEFDHIDTYEDISYVILVKLGDCEKCGNSYRYEEKYSFEGYNNLELIDGDC